MRVCDACALGLLTRQKFWAPVRVKVVRSLSTRRVRCSAQNFLTCQEHKRAVDRARGLPGWVAIRRMAWAGLTVLVAPPRRLGTSPWRFSDPSVVRARARVRLHAYWGPPRRRLIVRHTRGYD